MKSKILIYKNNEKELCHSFNKNNANQNSSERRTKQNRLMFVTNCVACNKKKFIKNQEDY